MDNLVKCLIWGVIVGGGDGSSDVMWYMEQSHAEYAAKRDLSDSEIFSVETFVDSNIFNSAAGNSEVVLYEHNIRIL